MEFHSLQELFYMDGRGSFVWVSYGIGAFVLALNVWRIKAKQTYFIKDQLRKYRRDQS